MRIVLEDVVQEFIELVRSGEKLKAIHHSRQHLAGWADCHLEDFQQVMGALVFGEESPCYPYRELFNSSQWNALADAFYKELYRLNNMTQQSLLTLELQVRGAHSPTPLLILQ
jgi:macrophage erythroblast attacher